MHFALTKRSFYALFIFTTALFLSCQKDLSIETGNNIQPPNLVTKVNSSVSGFVTDENNAAVKGATVQFGASTTTTDKYGYFEAKNVQVVKNAAVVTINKPGYFKGIKTYIAKEGKSAFFRIKLIPKTNVGNINGTSGGAVILTNGLRISLPAGAVVNAATNIAYTGTVNISAFWINPEAADLNSIMPGDLRGIDKVGSMKLLRTFGTAVVELTGSSGELLQIAAGKKATLTMPISSSLSATAPASIPLWYFDETNGLWKEEGSAVKTGNTYVGEVSHFSFWDGALYMNLVNFDCTVVDGSGNPLQNALVWFSYVNYPGSGAYGYTDATGYVAGGIPENTQLSLKIFGAWTCATPVYSQVITTTTANISLGPIIIPGTATVTGTITNCNNMPVINGCIYILEDYAYYRYAVNATGAFSAIIPLCNNPSPVTVIAQDLSNLQYGYPVSYNLSAGNNNVGNIIACGNATQEFIHYTVNSNNYYFDSPNDNFNQDIGHWGLPIMTIEAGSNAPNFSFAEILISQQNIATNSIQDLVSFKCQQVSDSLLATTPVPVNITEYGNIGQYISGNFSGTLTGTYIPANTYVITCNFRVKRHY